MCFAEAAGWSHIYETYLGSVRQNNELLGLVFGGGNHNHKHGAIINRTRKNWRRMCIE